MSDTENDRYPSDSGRATLNSSMTASAEPPSRRQRLPGISGTETDTGTESEMERFAKSRLRGSIDRPPPYGPGDYDDLARNGRSMLPPAPGKDHKTFPRPLTSDFVPWPSPDPISPKSILKHVGPPGRRDSSPAISPPLTPTGTSAEEPVVIPRRRFTLSVSPSRVGDSYSSGPDTDGDGSPVGRKRYIIRQTPSPSPKPRRAKMDLPPLPTKLSVVSEITLLPRLSTMPSLSVATASSIQATIPKSSSYFQERQPELQQEEEDERRFWASNVDNNNKPQIQERPSRAQYPSRSQIADSFNTTAPLSIGNLQTWDSSGPVKLVRKGSGSSSNGQGTSKSKRHPSKETMI